MDMHKQIAKRAGMEEQLNIELGPENLTQKKYENIVNNFLISNAIQVTVL